jgi:aspartate-semialdehyde dehydrogenase
MSDRLNIAVVGATGVVGEALLEILSARKFPVGEVFALASENSVGKQVDFGNQQLTVEDLAEFDFSRAQIGLFSAGGAISAEFAPKAAAAGCVVVDNTSHFRYDDDIPLVVPEVNPEAIADSGHNRESKLLDHSDACCAETDLRRRWNYAH